MSWSGVGWCLVMAGVPLWACGQTRPSASPEILPEGGGGAGGAAVVAGAAGAGGASDVGRRDGDCFDAALNGDETDVDCGGDCAPCVEVPYD